ncbi:MAG: methyltransferase [Bdellovibrionaceae bacterium]|nr:methyltransferase [Pseudobdellovibrionaceae bacterium]
MSLQIVATPIGHPEDITLRAIRALREAEALIGEERKPLFALLKGLDIPRPELIEYLNEHTSDEDLLPLLELCKTKKVVLVSDCGTPVFCDPGARLIQLCRKHNVEITSAPGASSLMVLLSVSAFSLKEFYFRGFLPAKTELRREAISQLKRIPCPIVLMDTPYRLKALLTDLKEQMSDYNLLLGLNLTAPEEHVIETSFKKLNLGQLPDKAEFILMIDSPQSASPNDSQRRR